MEEYKNKKLNEASDQELSYFLHEITDGAMSYPDYMLGDVMKFIKENKMSKIKVLNHIRDLVDILEGDYRQVVLTLLEYFTKEI